MYLYKKIILFLIFVFSLPAFSISTPDIGANTLFLYQNSNFHQQDANPGSLDANPNGLNVQEAELSFISDVDPYTRLNLLLSIAPKYKTDGTKITEEWTIEPEEAFAESNAIDFMTLKLGKFKSALGKHNTLHTHAYPFVLAPLTNVHLLGEEGLNDVGVSAAALVPTSWFNEVTLQALRGKGENDEFNSPSVSESVGLAHWKNLFDLSDELTLELGASYSWGQNSYKGQTSLTGADLTFKWRPSVGGKYHSLLWTTEYLNRRQTRSTYDDEVGSGIASWIQYQFTDRWMVAYRYDQFNMKNSYDTANLPNDLEERHSVGLTYLPSEFSSYKFEYDHRRGPQQNSHQENSESVFYLQANFTIGAHPAHAY